MQFCGEQRALGAQEQPVIRSLPAIHAILIRDQRPEYPTELDDAMPVAVAPKQPRNLEDQRDADLAQADCGDQALKGVGAWRLAPYRPRSSAMISTCGAAQPICRACSASWYCQRVLFGLVWTWHGVDRRT